MTNILLVDVSDADASLLAAALRVEGHDVVITRTVTEARELLASRPYSLAIIDLMLRSEGGGHGLELARELRREHPGMRVVLTSSYVLSERQLERADCGVSGFIPKPYDLREVVDFVQTKLSGPPSSRQLFAAEPASGVTSVAAVSDLSTDAAHRR